VIPVHVAGLAKRYGSVEALRGVTVEFEPAALTAILGPSGCGKTTLLRAIAGFVAVDAGAICFAGEDVTALPPQRRGSAMVFQNYALWPHMTVFENVAYGLRLKGVDRAEVDRRVLEALRLVEIGDAAGIARRKPPQLSGGQQQRVALARALVVEPRVLLLDEPLSNLDAKVRQRLRGEIRRLQRRVGITTIYVTHDQEEALAIADRVVIMNAGTIEQIGTPEAVYGSPGTAFAADFLGVGNRLAAEAGPGAIQVAGQRLAYPGALRGPVVLILRSSDAAVLVDGEAPSTPWLAGSLEESLFLGAYYRHYVRVGDQLLMVDGPARLRPGPVRIAIPVDRLKIFPEP
jgi:putative spermidine/putrescine transport system ATP-binding protein